MERTKKAFTLVEMLIVVVIIWLLAAVMMGRFQSFLQSGRDTSRQAWLKQLATTLEKYRVDYGDVFPAYSGSIENKSTNWLYRALVASGRYMDQLPVDPVSARPLKATIEWLSWTNWFYGYASLKASSTDNFGFLLLANSESPKWMNVVSWANAWLAIVADPKNDGEGLTAYSELKCVSVIFSWSNQWCWTNNWITQWWIKKWDENNNWWWMVVSWG